MRETIIFAPGLNGDELLRNMALHGTFSLNIRVMGAGELARYALQLAGVPVDRDLIGLPEQRLLVEKAMENNSLFQNISRTDVPEFVKAIDLLRGLAAGDDEETEIAETLSRGIFPDKNRALLEVYRSYLRSVEAGDRLDRIGLIRLAIGTGRLQGVEFRKLNSAVVSPLEQRLLNTLSGNTCREITLGELYGTGAGAPLRVEWYANCYGSANEAEMILSDIYGSKKKTDSCTVAVTEPGVYSRLFWDLAQEHNIPVTFGCGIPITKAAPAKLLRAYRHWRNDGFYRGEALGEMLNAPEFDCAAFYENAPAMPDGMGKRKFGELLGGLRLTASAEENRKILEAFEASIDGEPEGDNERACTRGEKLGCLPLLRHCAEQLSLPPYLFMERFSRIRKGSASPAETMRMGLDISARQEICARLRERGEEDDRLDEELFRDLMSAMVCRQRSAAGALHITSVDRIGASVRENLYLAGMASSMFPGAPRENYLLLDADLRLFGEAGEAYTSHAKVKRKSEDLLNALQLAADLGAKLRVSYPGMNVAELKTNNPSSLLFELFRRETGRDASSEELERNIHKIGYFDPAVSTAAPVGRAYAAGREPIPETGAGAADELPRTAPLLKRAFSPSAIDDFSGCPLSFYFGRVLHLYEPKEEEPFDAWTDAERGTAAHSVMEHSANRHLSKEAFLNMAEEVFDRFMAQKRPVIDAACRRERAEFLEMMENAYEQDPDRRVLSAEAEIVCLHEDSGITIFGYPDRVEDLGDGTVAIVDYKTGRTLKHKENDPDSCMQTMLYAYMVEQIEGKRVARGEYRYLRLGKTVTCTYDENARRKITERLTALRKALETGSFPAPDAQQQKDACKYCGYAAICPAKQQTGDEEED